MNIRQLISLLSVAFAADYVSASIVPVTGSVSIANAIPAKPNCDPCGKWDYAICGKVMPLVACTVPPPLPPPVICDPCGKWDYVQCGNKIPQIACPAPAPAPAPAPVPIPAPAPGPTNCDPCGKWDDTVCGKVKPKITCPIPPRRNHHVSLGHR